MAINLNFINKSKAKRAPDILIFQKNVATDFANEHTAWKVIKHCDRDENHPFVFETGFEITATDSYGNHSPKHSIKPGQLFTVTQSGGRDTLRSAGRGSSKAEMQVLNDLDKGAITVNLWRSGQLLSSKTEVAPGQKVIFEFGLSIFIRTSSDINEGNPIPPEIAKLDSIELSLLGVKSADIVMTGGKNKLDPYNFELENIEVD